MAYVDPYAPDYTPPPPTGALLPKPKAPAYVDPYAPDYTPPPPPPTLSGEFGKGVGLGVEGLKQAGYGAGALAGEGLKRLGAERLGEGIAQWGLEGALRAAEQAKQYTPAVESVGKIGSPREAALWASQGLGQLLPFAAGSVVGGGVGGLAGRALAGAAARKATERAIAQGAGELAAREAGAAALKQGVTRGTVAGLAGTSIPTEQGLIYADTYRETGERAPGEALGLGTLAGALDLIPEMRVARKILSPARGGLGKEMLKQAGAEAATEAAQTYLENRPIASRAPEKAAGLEELLNAAALGALGGGVMGGAAEGVSRLLPEPRESANPSERPALEHKTAALLDAAGVPAPALEPVPSPPPEPAPSPPPVSPEPRSAPRGSVGPGIPAEGALIPGAAAALGAEGAPSPPPTAHPLPFNDWLATARPDIESLKAVPAPERKALVDAYRGHVTQSLLPQPRELAHEEALQRSVESLNAGAGRDAAAGRGAQEAQAQAQVQAQVQAQGPGALNAEALYRNQAGAEEARAPGEAGILPGGGDLREQGQEPQGPRAAGPLAQAHLKILESFVRPLSADHPTRERAVSLTPGITELVPRQNDKSVRIQTARFPAFQGSKRTVAENYNEPVRAFFAGDRDTITEIDDYFGGGGGWGLFQANANFPSVKVLRVHEATPARMDKIRLFHEMGDRFASLAETYRPALKALEDTLTETPESLSQSVIARRASDALSGLPEGADWRLRGFLQAIVDKGTVNFGLGGLAQEGGTPEAALTDILRGVAKDALGAFQSASDFRARGGRIEYQVPGSSYDKQPAVGSHILSVVDPPYYGTKGYNGIQRVPVEIYRQTRDLVDRARQAGNAVIYTDEGWWFKNRKDKGVEAPDLPGDVDKDAGGMRASDILQHLRGGADYFGIMKVKKRYETLGLYRGTQPNTARLPDTVAATRQPPGRPLGRGGEAAGQGAGQGLAGVAHPEAGAVPPEGRSAGSPDTLKGWWEAQGRDWKTFTSLPHAERKASQKQFIEYLRSIGKLPPTRPTARKPPGAPFLEPPVQPAPPAPVPAPPPTPAAAPALAPGEAVGTVGAKAQVVTAQGTDIDVRYEVVDAADLITSNDLSGTINPEYPAALQPRDRRRAASLLQITRMAGNLDPERLGANRLASDGAPIVGSDNAVESGNGRVLAIRQAYAKGTAERYARWLKENAGRFGLPPDALEGIRQPVLIRRRTETLSDAQRAAFAREANQASIGAMAPAEQARMDAARITDDMMKLYRPTEEGNVLAPSNGEFLRAFANALGSGETAALVTSEGRWNKAMADRVRAAAFQKAYRSERLLSLMAEEADPDIRAVLTALGIAAPAFARARSIDPTLAGGVLDVIAPLVEAAEILRAARATRVTVEDVLAQQGLFERISENAALLARFLGANTRSPKRMGEGFSEIAAFLEREMRQLQNESLFERAPLTARDILDAASRALETRYAGQTKQTQAALFATPEQAAAGAPRAPSGPRRTGRQPTEEPGAAPEEIAEAPAREPRYSRAADRARAMDRDMAEQARYLQARAREEGTTSLEHWLRSHPQAFFKAAGEWRAANPPMGRRDTGAPSRGLNAAQAKAVIESFRRRYQGAAPIAVKVFPTQDAFMAEYGLTGDIGRVKGRISLNGRALDLVAENHESAAELWESLRHEIIGHHGVASVLGERFQGVMALIGESREAGVTALRDEVLRRQGTWIADNPQAIAEEVVALGAEYGLDTPFWRRIFGHIRAALRSIGLIEGAFTLDEVRALVAKSAANLRRDAYRGGMRLAERYHRAGLELSEPTEADWAEFQRLKASIHPPDPLSSEEFKRFFQGSRIRKADGSPLPVYHGTANAAKTLFSLPRLGMASGHATSGLGFFFTPDRGAAQRYGAHVIKAYLAIKKPYTLTDADLAGIESRSDAARVRERLAREGYDGAIVRAPGAKPYLIAFRGDQIKAADNTGAWGSRPVTEAEAARLGMSVEEANQAQAEGDIRYSRTPSDIKDSVSEFFMNRFGSDSKIGTLSFLNKTLNTPYHLARKFPAFKPVFDRAMDFQFDLNRIAQQSERLAPDVFRRLEGVREAIPGLARTGRATEADLDKASEAVLAGTHVDEKIYSDIELSERFGLSARQIALYRQILKSTQDSVEELARATMASIARGAGVDQASLQNARTMIDFNGYTGALTEALNARRKVATLGKAEALTQALKDIEAARMRTRDLIDKGYFPLMRFGRYTVDALDANNKRIFFSLYETKAQAVAMRRALQEAYPEAAVTAGTLNEQDYKLFQGIDLNSLALFLKEAGLETDPIAQKYLALTVNNHSALKRLIHRKNIPGFSKDVKRALAAFITSNARLAARNYHMGDMLEAVRAIPRGQGELAREATRLYEYLNNPQEEFARLRGFLFFNYLGGSIASAAVNLTQVPMVSLPYLSQYESIGKATRTLLKWYRAKPQSADHKAALKRAQEEGLVEPQEIYNLMAAARGGRITGGKGFQSAMYLWGGFFSLAEKVNRYVTFNAAYELAVGKGLKDPYEFARQAVDETQFLYGKHNRPVLGRGLGAPLFTFKQFTISYLELLSRLPPKSRALALGLLTLVAGASGLPGEDDLFDLLDTLAQWVPGADRIFSMNNKRALQDWAVRELGDYAPYFMKGITAGLPVDMAGRLGMENIIPGSAIFKQSQIDKTRDVAEAAGPVGGVARNVTLAAGAAARGDLGTAAYTVLPNAVKAMAQGVSMATTGEYRDARGRPVTEASGFEAFAKFFGFQPERVATFQERKYLLQQDINLQRVKEQGAAERWARGVVEANPAEIQAARREILAWNRRHPDMAIVVTRAQIERRVKELRRPALERFLRATPPEMRARAREGLAG